MVFLCPFLQSHMLKRAYIVKCKCYTTFIYYMVRSTSHSELVKNLSQWRARFFDILRMTALRLRTADAVVHILYKLRRSCRIMCLNLYKMNVAVVHNKE